ncbi:MAG: hypothetical protein P4L33_04075 [Capsulimonadaceae bacterium]|nr:hypothetical protein [Capsulimonadaceae bacterium]
MNRRDFIVGGAATLAMAGCAKYPSSSSTSSASALLVSMTVAGVIDPNSYYFVVFNTSNDSAGASGPTPVVAPPWGNGFVSGAATHFVEYHGNLAADGYEIYRFVAGTSLQQYTAVGVPSQVTTISSTSNTIQFRIPLSVLATSTILAGAITNIQINFLTTDRIPVNPQDTSPKLFDALGNSNYGSGQLNDYITISTTTGATYNNSYENIEPAGDVQQTNGSGGYSQYNAPNLDITGWSVQVQT